MPHALILGQTESGKTTLAKQLARKFCDRGISVLVLDPLRDPAWSASYVTADPGEFFDLYWQNESCAVFIDESGELCSSKNYAQSMVDSATRGRHYGHKNFYIAQRGTLIRRTIRDQCRDLFLFNSGLEDCKIHSAEWNAPNIRHNGPFLKKGEFLHKPRMGDLTAHKLF